MTDQADKADLINDLFLIRANREIRLIRVQKKLNMCALHVALMQRRVILFF